MKEQKFIGFTPLRILYIFVMPDDGTCGPDGLLYSSDRRLIELSSFLGILRGLPRGISEYFKLAHKKSFLSTVIGYDSFSIRFVCESNLNKEFMDLSDIYPLKVIVLRDAVDDKTINALKGWSKRPLILTESPSLAEKLRSVFDSPIISLTELNLETFEEKLCEVVDGLMAIPSYVRALPWSTGHIEVLSKITSNIKAKRDSLFPKWPLRENRMISTIDLIINRTRGHVDYETVSIESSEELWIKTLISSAYQCLAELALMEVLAYFENEELSEEDLRALDISNEDLAEILKEDFELYSSYIEKFKKRYDLLHRNNGILLWCPSINPYFLDRL